MRNWHNLTDIDFEELTADLLSAEHSTPVERFGRGADGGLDLRWLDKQGRTIIAQCKHYLNSSYSDLKRSAAKEIPKVKKLNPYKYLFVTSKMLTANQKSGIKDLLDGLPLTAQGVISGTDLEQMLDRHATVERKHMKLWISTGTELFWATHSDLLNRSEALRDRIDSTIRRYVGISAFASAQRLLESEKICLIAGQPGIGKTSLAHMLVAEYIARGFEVVEISGDIAEAWATLDHDRAQIFLYDDFLGQLSLSDRLSKNEDTRILDFVEKIRHLKAKRLVLTTREYILQDAIHAYPQMENVSQYGKYILELEEYSRDDRARILYNHVWHSDINRNERVELSNGGWKRIVDHPNYSPRLIEYGTRLRSNKSPDISWIERFADALDNPSKLWKQSFENNLQETDRLLLAALASFGRSVELSALQASHQSLCWGFSIPNSPTRFLRTLDTLDGSFLKLEKDHRGTVVSFDNPSIVDFMLNNIRNDHGLQIALLQGATHFEQVQRLWSGSAAPITVLNHRSTGRGRRDVLNASNRVAYSDALKRTISAPALLPRTKYFDSQPQNLEQRLEFIWKLPDEWRPETSWIESVSAQLTKRWQDQEGSKADAYSLFFENLEIQELFPTDAASVLESWIKSDFSSTSDWVILGWLLDLKETHEIDDSYTERFEAHATSELAAWDPSPPDLDELRSLAGQFGLDYLDVEFDEALRREEAQEDSAHDVIRHRPRTLVPPRIKENDEDIEQYFDHF